MSEIPLRWQDRVEALERRVEKAMACVCCRKTAGHFESDCPHLLAERLAALEAQAAPSERGEAIMLHRLTIPGMRAFAWEECLYIKSDVAHPAGFEHRTAHFAPPLASSQQEEKNDDERAADALAFMNQFSDEELERFAKPKPPDPPAASGDGGLCGACGLGWKAAIHWSIPHVNGGHKFVPPVAGPGEEKLADKARKHGIEVVSLPDEYLDPIPGFDYGKPASPAPEKAWRPDGASQLAKEQASVKMKGFDAIVRRVQGVASPDAAGRPDERAEWRRWTLHFDGKYSDHVFGVHPGKCRCANVIAFEVIEASFADAALAKVARVEAFASSTEPPRFGAFDAAMREAIKAVLRGPEKPSAAEER